MRSAPVEKQTVLNHLKRQRKPVLLEYLSAALREMTEKQRRTVFSRATDEQSRTKRLPASQCDPRALRRDVAKFRRDSFARKYYRPFMIDSKNFMHVPSETTAWCDRFAQL